MKWHLNLKDCSTFLIWNYPQVGHILCGPFISVVIIARVHNEQDMQLCVLAISSFMITTLMPQPQTDMPHLRIGPYKEGVTIVQIQMQFYPIVQNWTLLQFISS